MNHQFIIGQRWISDTEPELGLGTIVDIDERTISVLFLAVAETRRFAKQTAPLSRVRFSEGDIVQSRDEWSLKVGHVHEQDGLLAYKGLRLDTNENIILPEADLNYFIEFNSPKDKLFNGQIDAHKWFDLRYQTLSLATRLDQRQVNGLAGARISLVPHQLYIANEVASRYAPRVLLADEVGLGKTIEACLILNQQLLTGRAQRVLIIVPDALVHQWLVELLRKFNLRFSIFNEERCLDEAETHNFDNPFLAEQHILCSLAWFSEQPHRAQQALAVDWDLLIVDEAHHLQWSETEASPEYCFIEKLAQQTKGLLLLTATPEQLGQAGHFARLRLLDPDRFHDYAAFIEEEKRYIPLADTVNRLLDQKPLSASDIEIIEDSLGYTPDASTLKDNSAAIVSQLIDRHGTGRVLFRNTRNHIKGFPERRPHMHALPLPDQYRNISEFVLSPELNAADTWASFDTRIPWLGNLLKTLKPEKCLLICAHAQTAIALEEHLRKRQGIASAVFHEDMSIVARDRAAAYFAEEDGARILLCSEIGSEGRNFQFAHHLILFDLPLNPDLLEQRIGRLDRIGQKNTVEIHIPYFEGSAQHKLQRWYHEGLNAFQHACASGTALLAAFKNELHKHFHSDNESAFSELLTKTQQLNQELNTRIQQGRDRLLETSSFNAASARNIHTAITAEDNDPSITHFMESVFDIYGVDSEHHSDHCLILRPGDHMQSAQFPELPADGATITFDRNTALAHEDRLFITWDHPMVRACIDRILSDHQGQTAITTIDTKKLKSGTFLLEALYELDCTAPKHLNLHRYLPERLHRIVLDQAGRNLGKALPAETLQDLHQSIDKTTASKIMQLQKNLVKKLLSVTQAIADKNLPANIQASIKSASAHLQPEIERLTALQKVNPNIRQEEIDFLIEQKDHTLEAIQTMRFRLDAIRLIIVS